MRRVWFKREMKEAILAGRKTATTRTHPLALDECLAVSGSRFKAVPFAIIKITDRFPARVEDVINSFYKEEGFNSPEAMGAFADRERLPVIDAKNPVFFHRFEVVRILVADGFEMPYYRKCSQCGFVEPVAWRGSRFNVDWEIADWDEFARAYPNVASQIGGLGERYRLVSGDFVFWRQAGHNPHLIHRLPLVIYKANGNHCRGRGTYAELKLSGAT